MNYSDLLKQYVSIGKPLSEYQFDKIKKDGQLLNSYFYSRNKTLGYYSLEKYEVNFIEDNPKYFSKFDKNNLIKFMRHSSNPDAIANKIIDVKGDTLDEEDIYPLLRYSLEPDKIVMKIDMTLIYNAIYRMGDEGIKELIENFNDIDMICSIVIQAKGNTLSNLSIVKILDNLNKLDDPQYYFNIIIGARSDSLHRSLIDILFKYSLVDKIDTAIIIINNLGDDINSYHLDDIFRELKDLSDEDLEPIVYHIGEDKFKEYIKNNAAKDVIGLLLGIEKVDYGYSKDNLFYTLIDSTNPKRVIKFFGEDNVKKAILSKVKLDSYDINNKLLSKSKNPYELVKIFYNLLVDREINDAQRLEYLDEDLMNRIINDTNQTIIPSYLEKYLRKSNNKDLMINSIINSRKEYFNSWGVGMFDVLEYMIYHSSNAYDMGHKIGIDIISKHFATRKRLWGGQDSPFFFAEGSYSRSPNPDSIAKLYIKAKGDIDNYRNIKCMIEHSSNKEYIKNLLIKAGADASDIPD